LQSGTKVSTVWEELWDELHHQGDVGDASYASVPYLVRIYGERPSANWNIYAIVATIELARKSGGNSDVPPWLEEDYFAAIQELAKLGLSEIAQTKDPESVRAILSVLAIAKGARAHARFILNYSDDELLELERAWLDR
jgi:hypothetical protein